MEGSTSRKRSLMETEFSDPGMAPSHKRLRFPKGKKAKHAPEVVPAAAATSNRGDADEVDDGDPRLAAKKRAEVRSRMTTQIFTEEEEQFSDLSRAEVRYEVNENFVDDGIQIEPFNLNKEREEGYFDASGNYVEYANEKEEKDAWLDNVEVDAKLAEKLSLSKSKDEEDEEELSPDDLGQMKRRIADALEPGETVLQALRRLKGNSNNRKEKMSLETKLIFDRLTEDAMKLMENGDYNVYHEMQEVFQREAEGYERLTQARRIGLSAMEVVSDAGTGATVGPSSLNGSTPGVPLADADPYDMFGGDNDNDNVSVNASSAENSAVIPNGRGVSSETSVNDANQDAGTTPGQADYVYDESSGYYYNSSTGYYYDPTSGLYCCASTGRWYCYNEDKNEYDEVEAGTN